MKYTSLLGIFLALLLPQISVGQEKSAADAQNYYDSEQPMLVADTSEDFDFNFDFDADPTDDASTNNEENPADQDAPNDDAFQDFENNQFDQPDQSNDDPQNGQGN